MLINLKNFMSKLRSIFIKTLNLNDKKFSNSLSIANCEEWDSANHMMLIVEIEKSFKIRLKNAEIIKMNSYLKIEKMLKKKLNYYEEL